MIDSQLILIEGLPSTGKTTNARLIHIQLERNNTNAEWIHEIAMPHPLLFFDEAVLTYDGYRQLKKSFPKAAGTLNTLAVYRKNSVGFHLHEIQWNCIDEIGEDAYMALSKYDVWNCPLDTYKQYAIDKWTHFIDNAPGKKVYIIDSAIFQYQIFRFLFDNKPYEELQSFVDQITEIISPLKPCLIFLHRNNAEESINNLENDRGTSYLEYIWERDKKQTYYADKPPGAESFKQFLRDYAGMADLLFEKFPRSKISVDISDGCWGSHENEMLSFLGIERLPLPNVYPPSGDYKNEALGYKISVDGLVMTDPTDNQKRKLYPKSHNEFYVDWLPVVLRFDNNSIVIAGSQVADRWTTTGMVYHKINGNPI